MKKTLLVGTLLASAFAFQANAEGTLSYNIGVTSDYVFRGYTQNDKNIAVQGGVDYSIGSFYAGTWASPVNFKTGESATEVDIYAGYKPTLGKYSFDLGAITYAYGFSKDLPFFNTELKAAVSRPLGSATVGAVAYYDVDLLKTYYEANISYPLIDKVTLSGAYGYQDFTKFKKWAYPTANAGLTYALTPKYSVDTRYITSFGEQPEAYVVTLKATFQSISPINGYLNVS